MSKNCVGLVSGLSGCKADAQPGAGAAQPPAGGFGPEQGTPPSNTVPHNSTEEGCRFFQPLRWGVDSLYLSYKGQVRSKVEDELQRLKAMAQSIEPHQVAKAQYAAREHVFEVKDKGSGLFPFTLEDNAFRIQCPKHNSRSMPAAYVKISSHALAAREADVIEAELALIVSQLAQEVQGAKVSRIDLFVDFVSEVPMEAWPREAWITRANSINQYSQGGQFSGWTVGAGGTLSARLYDKTLEIATKSGKTYLYPLWSEEGWDGESQVWRLEFQFKTEILGQVGLRDFHAVMNNLAGLWGYATIDWLKLAVPKPEDATRSRWPLHPLWLLLATVPFDGVGGELSRTFSTTRGPSKRWLMQQFWSHLISFAAMEGTRSFEETVDRMADDVRWFHDEKAFREGLKLFALFAEQVALKRRKFNSAMNATADDLAEQERKFQQAEADAYNRSSKG